MTRCLALAACLGLVCLTAPADLAAAPPDLKVPEKVSGEVGAYIPIRAETTGKFVRFKAVTPGINLFPADLLADKKATVASAAAPGTYVVAAVTGNADGPSEIVSIEVTVTASGKVVVVPKVDPKVDPVPDPKVDPRPVPAKEFRVLFVYESMARLSEAHKTILNSTALYEYLDRKCVKNVRGHPEYRKWDYQVETKDEAPVWQEIWASLRPQLRPNDPPYVVLIDGKVGKYHPVPDTLAATLSLLKTVGGE